MYIDDPDLGHDLTLMLEAVLLLSTTDLYNKKLFAPILQHINKTHKVDFRIKISATAQGRLPKEWMQWTMTR